MSNAIVERKRQLRDMARRRRIAVDKADEKSRAILARALQLPEFLQARVVMIYVHAGSEVRTQPFLPQLLATGKTIAVPWCEADELQIFHLRAVDELAPGMYNILEPRRELRERAERRLSPQALDVIFAPGVAFDPQGRRLGQGRGYYDRLFAQVRPDAVLVGLLYETQMLPEIPVEEHDVQLHYLVTETALLTPRFTRPNSTGRSTL
jgi:5-formyltetrahydrofolate cyclo-ligase